MNAIESFAAGTRWDADYLSRRRPETLVAGYRGPFSLRDQSLATFSSMLAPLLESRLGSHLSPQAVVRVAAQSDRLLVAWTPDEAVAVLTARHVVVGELTGWYLTLAAVVPALAGTGLCGQLIRTLVREEPADFVAGTTNSEAFYRSLRSIAPRAIHPDANGRYDSSIEDIARHVLAVILNPDSVAQLGPDLVRRGCYSASAPTDRDPVESAEPTEAAEGEFRRSLGLTDADGAFVLSDVSGVIASRQRHRLAIQREHTIGVSERLRTVGVTGTNGKTSVVEYGRQLGDACGLRCASYGSLGIVTERGRTRRTHVGAGPRGLPLLMQRLWDVGLDLLWLEAFSNTLSQGVFDGVEVDVAVFTQAGVDHVGTHGSLAAYWAAKDRLFETVVRSNGVVVIDPTAPGADRILDIAARRQLKMVTTGAGQTVELTATTMRIGSHTLGVRMPVCETVMVQNLELAIGAALALELDMRQVAQACARLTGPPGRFQEVDLPAPFRIVIDAAHNADALEALLRELEVLTSGRLLLLIGSVGTADLVRWEPLGEVADVFADIVVITDESPYGLDAATIRAAIRRGCPRAVEIPDRREGVQWLVAQARPGDTVVVAGRADEDFVVDEHGAVPYPTDAELLRAAVGSPSSARPVDREGDQASDQLGVQDAGPPS